MVQAVAVGLFVGDSGVVRVEAEAAAEEAARKRNSIYDYALLVDQERRRMNDSTRMPKLDH